MNKESFFVLYYQAQRGQEYVFLFFSIKHDEYSSPLFFKCSRFVWFLFPPRFFLERCKSDWLCPLCPWLGRWGLWRCPGQTEGLCPPHQCRGNVISVVDKVELKSVQVHHKITSDSQRKKKSTNHFSGTYHCFWRPVTFALDIRSS